MTVLSFRPAVVTLNGVRAGDRNEFAGRLHQSGVPVDLTAVTLSAQARVAAEAEDPPALEAIVEVTDPPTDGRFTVRWPGEAVRGLLAGAPEWVGVWDLQMANGAGDPVTVMAGGFKAEMDVTR
jgi:hypothetical protein